MNKNDLYNNIKPQFEYLFPDLEIENNFLNIIYDMTTLDLMIKRNVDIDFYTLFWVRLFLNLYRAYDNNYNFENTPYSQDIYIEIYNNFNEKYKPINFKC